VVILFTLSVFFSFSHFEVKYGIKYLFRKIPHSKEKIDEVYQGIAARLKSQLILCVFIGLTSYLGLRILDWIGFDLPQKGVLALLAGLFEIIPYL
jgi:predicted PurR-regulated permease PerM